MKLKYLFLSISFICFALLESCKKFVDIDPPKSQLVTSKVFADSLDANSAIVGIYIDMYQSFGFAFASGGLTAYPGLSSDEFSQSSNDPELLQFLNNRININNGYNNILWSSAYKYIYDANACIEGISKSERISTLGKSKLIGEAKQLRALMYFYLTNLYGPVPLVLSTDYSINRSLGRTPVDSIYSQIIKDLNDAQANLPKLGTAERANFYSATALLSKVYLYKKEYQKAESCASLVINSGNYHLEPNLNNVFLANSSEAIWKILPVFPGFETWEGYNFVPSDPTAAPQYILGDDLYSSFETGDLRKVNWIAFNTIGGENYPYPFKYKAATTSGAVTENYVIIRLAELYLIRAEARAFQNNISGAQSDINIVRIRAGISNTTASDKDSFLLAIEGERRAELFCEWGNRWFDLQRTGRVDLILKKVKPNWSHDNILYPVPDAQIKNNSSLNQNAGY